MSKRRYLRFQKTGSRFPLRKMTFNKRINNRWKVITLMKKKWKMDHHSGKWRGIKS